MIGTRLKILREERDMGQQDLCKLLSIEQSTLANYENNRRTPKLEILIKIAKHLNVSTDYLLGLTNQKNTYGYAVNSETTNEDLGNSINYWIRKSGYDNEQLAGQLEISEKVLDNYCSGTGMPLEILIEMSKICGISTDCLLGLRESSRPERDGVMPFQFDPEISRRLKDQATQMDESYGFIADVLGIEENEVFNFFEYGFVPHLDVFVKIVEHYVVSSDYLLNRTSSTMTILCEEERLLKAYRNLDRDNQAILLGDALKAVKNQEFQKYARSQSVAADYMTNTLDKGKSLA